MTVKINIIYYSLYGHTYKLAQHIKKGIDASGVATGILLQVAETLPAEVLVKMHAPSKPSEVPVAAVDDLVNADAVMFGIPTRYGSAPAQVKALLDATGQLWMKGALVGKMAGLFFSTSSQHGGQETTALTFLTQLVHHGMIYVPLGYTSPHLTDNSEVIGGSPYGAGTITSPDGSRMPSEKELQIAEHQGKLFATTVARYVKK